MVRLTINLSEERQRALKQAAAERGKTMGQLVEKAAALVLRARKQAGLAETEALELGVEAARAVRRRSSAS